MKVLVFYIGRERYALPLAGVDQVLPVARLKALPGAPHFVPGLLDLHGEAVPVVDLSRLAGSPPDAVRYDTRILLVEVPVGGRRRRLGLKAERVSGIATIADTLDDPGVVVAPWLGRVATGAVDAGNSGSSSMLQLLVPECLLDRAVEILLFGEEADASA